MRVPSNHLARLVLSKILDIIDPEQSYALMLAITSDPTMPSLNTEKGTHMTMICKEHVRLPLPRSAYMPSSGIKAGDKCITRMCHSKNPIQV